MTEITTWLLTLAAGIVIGVSLAEGCNPAKAQPMNVGGQTITLDYATQAQFREIATGINRIAAATERCQGGVK